MVQDGASADAAAGRVHAAGVGDDFEMRLVFEKGDEAFQHVEKVGRIARFGVSLSLQRQDRHGEFGQVFQCEIIKIAFFG